MIFFIMIIKEEQVMEVKYFNKFGIYHSWISRWKDEVHGEYPTQVVYYDNLFRSKSRKKNL